MRVISRYETQEKGEAGLRFRGEGEVVFLPHPDWPKKSWALVDRYEPKEIPRGGVFVCREEDIAS